MSQRVFLHVGLPKSGTTYLQAVLGKNKSTLKHRARLLYPGETWARQVDAVRDVRRMRVPPSQRATVTGAWDRLVAEMQVWPDDSLMSMEWLCMANPAQIQRITKDLAPAEVHVVFTVRDVARTVPAAWQEFSQNRATWRWPEFLEQVTGEDPMSTPAGKAFWGQQDMELLLERWGSVIPAERLHVVTLPQSGADPAELWRRMARVVGIDPEGYDLSDLGSNASLGMESAELMRRVNERLQEHEISVGVYNKVFKHRLSKNVLAARKGEESKVLLPAEYHDWAQARAEQQIEAVDRSGAQVVGDLADLRPLLDATGQAQTVASEPDADAVLDAAVHALIVVALEPPRRRRKRAATQPVVPVNRAPIELLGRIRGRSPRALAEAVVRRVRRTPGSGS
ncbi:MAG TPA: sulfotransferase [Nocardioidaceae bacterium]|nr:sulfotransferase [Nocardioidaceae bacterium]